MNSRPFHCFLFSLIFITVKHIKTTTTTLASNETDRLALLDFKLKISQDPQNVLRTWNSSLHFCHWEGVTCGKKHKRVTALDLSSKGLIGSLSPYLGNLSFLREVRFHNNTLQGKIPHELGHLLRLQYLKLAKNSLVGNIPANLSYCVNLYYLNLGHNKLQGKVPVEFQTLLNLKLLGIHENNLNGGIPNFLGNLTSLEYLSAAYNSLGGSIPDTLGQLRNLKALGLGGNNLSGIIPSSIYNLSFITIFSLSQNQLQGSLPQNLGFHFPYLQLFEISQNSFHGSIPISFSNATDLESLEMYENYFSGKVSVNFGGMEKLGYLNMGKNNLGSGDADEMNFFISLANCSNLQSLYLSSNKFRGVLPHSISSISIKLEKLLLDRNQFYGSIPSGIGNLTSLYLLGMEQNEFSGSIPVEIGNLQKLQWMAINDNNLSGYIPSSLGKLSALTELHLNNNNLQGNIPFSLGQCQNLMILHLFQNELTGNIPHQIFDISDLSISLNLAQNHFFGPIPSQVGNLKNLERLDFSENNLSGEIPQVLGFITHLEKLFLRSNNFQGHIPSSFINLKGIQIIDLSANNLSGLIPRFLGTLSLNYLNLSDNNFEGEVPSEGVFKNGKGFSILGNKRLCGGISELGFPRCPPVNEVHKRRLSAVHKILISIASAVAGVAILSCFLTFYCIKGRSKQSSEAILGKEFVQVSYEKLLKATDGFSVSNLIGVGSFGSVYKGILDIDGTIVAVKVLNLQHRGASRSFLTECKALRNIRHRNLVKIITCCSSTDFQGNDFKALVFEFMSNGSLEKWLHRVQEDNHQSLSLLQRINIGIDVASALDYLHQHNIVHCDLKPSNILLDSNMTAHVGDFGLSRFLLELSNSNPSTSVRIRGTIGYIPPEYALGCEASKSGDVYGFGITLLEMITGKIPTDPMFTGDLNLHTYSRMALPGQVDDIVDPRLLTSDEEATMENRLNARQEARNCRRKECLTSIVKIGVACTQESKQDRVNIDNVLHDLELARDLLTRQ